MCAINQFRENEVLNNLCCMKLYYASFMLFYLVHASIRSQRDSKCSYVVVFFNLRNGRSFLNDLQEKLGT